MVSKWDEGEYLLLGLWLKVVISIIRSTLRGNDGSLLWRARLGLGFPFDLGGLAADGLRGDWVLLNCGGGVILMESD